MPLAELVTQDQDTTPIPHSDPPPPPTLLLRRFERARTSDDLEELAAVPRYVVFFLLWLLLLVARDAVSKLPTFRVVEATDLRILKRKGPRPAARLRAEMIAGMKRDSQAYARRAASLVLSPEHDEGSGPIDDSPDFPELDQARDELSRV